jgi:hypothetical protein
LHFEEYCLLNNTATTPCLYGHEKHYTRLVERFVIYFYRVTSIRNVAGIAPEMTEKILETIRELLAKGKTAILIEHNLDAVMQVCDRVVFMDAGAKVSEERSGTARFKSISPSVDFDQLSVVSRSDRKSTTESQYHKHRR